MRRAARAGRMQSRVHTTHPQILRYTQIFKFKEGGRGGMGSATDSSSGWAGILSRDFLIPLAAASSPPPPPLLAMTRMQLATPIMTLAVLRCESKEYQVCCHTPVYAVTEAKAIHQHEMSRIDGGSRLSTMLHNSITYG